MSVLPIIFSTEMVRAILDGRKTVTRRVVKPQPAGNAALLRWDYGYAGVRGRNICGTALPPRRHPLDWTISPVDVAAMMALLKLARIASGGNLDCFIDLAGYAACASEIFSKEKSNEN